VQACRKTLLDMDNYGQEGPATVLIIIEGSKLLIQEDPWRQEQSGSRLGQSSEEGTDKVCRDNNRGVACTAPHSEKLIPGNSNFGPLHLD